MASISQEALKLLEPTSEKDRSLGWTSPGTKRKAQSLFFAYMQQHLVFTVMLSLHLSFPLMLPCDCYSFLEFEIQYI